MNKQSTRVSPPVGRRSRPRSRSGASTAAGDDPMRATAASAAGPSRGGGVVVQSIRPKLVPVHISPASIRSLQHPKRIFEARIHNEFGSTIRLSVKL